MMALGEVLAEAARGRPAAFRRPRRGAASGVVLRRRRACLHRPHRHRPAPIRRAGVRAILPAGDLGAFLKPAFPLVARGPGRPPGAQPRRRARGRVARGPRRSGWSPRSVNRASRVPCATEARWTLAPRPMERRWSSSDEASLGAGAVPSRSGPTTRAWVSASASPRLPVTSCSAASRSRAGRSRQRRLTPARRPLPPKRRRGTAHAEEERGERRRRDTMRKATEATQ